MLAMMPTKMFESDGPLIWTHFQNPCTRYLCAKTDTSLQPPKNSPFPHVWALCAKTPLGAVLVIWWKMVMGEDDGEEDSTDPTATKIGCNVCRQRPVINDVYTSHDDVRKTVSCHNGRPRNWRFHWLSEVTSETIEGGRNVCSYLQGWIFTVLCSLTTRPEQNAIIMHRSHRSEAMISTSWRCQKRVRQVVFWI